MSNDEAVLQIVNAFPEVERAAEWLQSELEQVNAPARIIGKLQVVIDELIANIINHGLRGVPSGTRPIELRLRKQPHIAELEIIDDGAEFDPTTPPPLPVAGQHGTRPLGGTGLPFLRGLMNDLHYVRHGDQNRLIMRVRWTTPTD